MNGNLEHEGMSQVRNGGRVGLVVHLLEFIPASAQSGLELVNYGISFLSQVALRGSVALLL